MEIVVVLPLAQLLVEQADVLAYLAVLQELIKLLAVDSMGLIFRRNLEQAS